MRIAWVCLLAAALAMLSAGAQSQVQVFNSFGPGYTSNGSSGSCVSGPDTPNCGPTTARWIAETFMPSSSGNLDYLDLALSYNSGTQGAIISLVADNGGSPAPLTSVLETLVASKLPKDSNKAKVKVKSKLHPALTAGTSYWIIAAPLGYDSLSFWQQSPTATGGTFDSLDGGQTWFFSGGSPFPAFDVFCTVA